MGCGCSDERETIEAHMLELKLLRNKIKEQKALKMKEYEFMTGEKLTRPFIPDHIDHKAMRHDKGIITPPPEIHEEKEESSEKIEDEDEEQGNNNLQILQRMKTITKVGENNNNDNKEIKEVNQDDNKE